MPYLKQALTIASSDPGGGAGIQGDIKAMQANGVFGLSVLVALTAQNTKRVSRVFPIPSDFIQDQMGAVFEDFEVGAVKTGMLYSREIVRAVSEGLKKWRVSNLLVDPVMVSTSGAELLQADAIEEMKEVLFPLARIVTPNISEAQILSGQPINNLDDVKNAAHIIHRYGCQAVLIKGGHLISDPATDLFFDGDHYTILPGEFLETSNTHGTGCTYSSAITAQLALGNGLLESVQSAKAYVTETIRHSLSIGHGPGPMDHFFAYPVKTEKIP